MLSCSCQFTSHRLCIKTQIPSVRSPRISSNLRSLHSPIAPDYPNHNIKCQCNHSHIVRAADLAALSAPAKEVGTFAYIPERDSPCASCYLGSAGCLCTEWICWTNQRHVNLAFFFFQRVCIAHFTHR